jgi:hypothetical protein
MSKAEWDATWKLFDSLDEAGKHAIAAVFLSTPETGKDSEYHKAFVRRGFAAPEGKA